MRFTRSTPTKLANWLLAYRITSRCTSTASWMRSPSSVKSFGPAFVAAGGARGAQQQLVDRHADGLHVELTFELLCELDALGQTFAADGALNGER